MVFNRYVFSFAVICSCIGILWWNPISVRADTAIAFNAVDIVSDSDVESGSNASGDSDKGGDDVDEVYDASAALPYLENIDRLVTDIHAEIVPDEVSDPGQHSVMSLSSDEVADFALAGDFGLDNNVVIYEGFWGSESYRAVFPAAYEQYLIITDDGYLYNVSGSSVTGRLFQDEVDYESYEYSSLVLSSVLGNVASTIYSYGYPSYVRTYFDTGTRISFKDTYGLFRVDNVVRTDSADPVRIGNNYMLVMIMIGGVLVLCFMKKSQA